MKSGSSGLPYTPTRTDLAHEVHPHRIAAQREESGMSESENPAISPHQIDSERQERIRHVLADQGHCVGRHVQTR